MHSFVPTVVIPSSRYGSNSLQAAFSTIAAAAGVAKTSNAPLPMLRAVLLSVTIVLTSAFMPVFNSLMLVIPFFGLDYASINCYNGLYHVLSKISIHKGATP